MTHCLTAKHPLAVTVFKDKKMTLFKNSFLSLLFVGLIALMLGYEWIDGKPYLLGYAYVMPSLILAGIDTKSLWEVEDENFYCGITTDNEYVMVVRDSIFVGAVAKEVCLNP